jgi:hypothetical protein
MFQVADFCRIARLVERSADRCGPMRPDARVAAPPFFEPALGTSISRVECVSWLKWLSDDLWRLIATFSEDELVGILKLQRVNRQFRVLMRHPSVVSHLKLRFNCFLEKDQVEVACGRMRLMPIEFNYLDVGVRAASVGHVKRDSLKRWPHLRNLTLYNSIVPELDHSLDNFSLEWCKVKDPDNLKRMRCKKLEIHDKWWKYKTFNCGWISEITGLESLTLKKVYIENLDFIVKVRSLQTLRLSECAELRDVQGLFALKNLHSLTLEASAKLTEIKAIAGLSGLNELNLLECHNIPHFDVQEVLCKLFKLQRLAILHHKIEKLDFAQLKLTHLRLYDCIRLVSVCNLPPGLLFLNLEHCFRLEDFSELTKLIHLTQLNVSHTQIQTLPNLPSLRILNVQNCQALSDAGLLGVLPCLNLERVHVENCDNLSDDFDVSCLLASNARRF